jgi:hypothetical protein
VGGCSGVELAPVQAGTFSWVGADVTYVAIGSDDHDAAILEACRVPERGDINVGAGLRLDASATAADTAWMATTVYEIAERPIGL